MKLFSLLSGKKPDARTLEKQRRAQTANEFVNVRDVRGPILYGKNGLVFAFLRIQPVSLELLSQSEKERKIKTFSAEFSAEKKAFKFFSISRPVDISGLLAYLSELLSEATDPVRKELLHHELREISAFALTGEITERQFYLALWESGWEDKERELFRRAQELESKFMRCDIKTELCGQGAIIRLLNLFGNPNYAHLEDGDISPAIPFLNF
jgi:hypothetical protein